MTLRLEQLLQYDSWANREALKSLGQAIPPPRSLKWMGHIIGAEFLWLARLEGETSELPVWPDLSLKDCGKRLGEMSRLLDDVAQAGPERLAEPISYTNSKGESWTNTVEEILTHLVIHSAYHRGQIASDVRAAGQTPAYTDYIHAVRQGLVE
ncbi:MAG TPA: DinB family protein [Gemmatimonadales bacterium]